MARCAGHVEGCNIRVLVSTWMPARPRQVEPETPESHCHVCRVCPCHPPASQAEDVIRLTQQLQLLHVTKEFQQQVKAGANSSSSRPGSDGQGVGRTATAGAAAAAGSSAAAAGKEVANLENLLKVRTHTCAAMAGCVLMVLLAMLCTLAVCHMCPAGCTCGGLDCTPTKRVSASLQ